jgi:aspartyl-tRNA(Asn)/glutamyl-tRNA(Gln) amidotransferase subunit B
MDRAAIEYEAVMGLEVHAQLLTKSKMFCGCSAEYSGAAPNTHVCPVCMGMPGVLPVINRRAVELTLMVGLALHCEIPEATKWDRKNYFYPDLPKGYQISQYDLPLCVNGWIDVEVDGQTRRIRIHRAHLEEDTGRLTHTGSSSLVDLNRAGVPLLEIVTEPDIRSPAEARAYATRLRAILRSLGASSGNMEQGAMRVEPNISLRPAGTEPFGTKTEVKNINSLRALERAAAFEIERQRKLLQQGGRIEQETRGWVEDRGVTVSQRSKESAHDYRYFPEPDLPPLLVSREWVEELRRRLPELPEARRLRFMERYGLSSYDATQLAADRAIADFFETAVRAYPEPKKVANWVQSELFRLLNETETDVEQAKVTPQGLVDLLGSIDKGTLSTGLAKQVFEAMFRQGKSPAQVIEEQGLSQISGEDELAGIVQQVLSEHPKPVADYRAGKLTAIGFLKGQVMRATKGKANPDVLDRLLKKHLDGQA